jgi:hypothetical protein
LRGGEEEKEEEEEEGRGKREVEGNPRSDIARPIPPSLLASYLPSLKQSPDRPAITVSQGPSTEGMYPVDPLSMIVTLRACS